MKIMAQIAVIGALVAGATTLNAQTNVTSATNIDLLVNISLTGVVQSDSNSVTRVKMGSRDVILAVQPGASAKAKLLARYSPEGGDPVFVVRDGGTDTVLDPGTLKTVDSGNVVTTSTTTRSGVTTVRTVEIREFILNTATGTFDVAGYTTSNGDNRGLHRGELFDATSPTALSAKVAGNMTDSAGNPGVFQGTISMGGRRITEE